MGASGIAKETEDNVGETKGFTGLRCVVTCETAEALDVDAAAATATPDLNQGKRGAK